MVAGPPNDTTVEDACAGEICKVLGFHKSNLIGLRCATINSR